MTDVTEHRVADHRTVRIGLLRQSTVERIDEIRRQFGNAGLGHPSRTHAVEAILRAASGDAIAAAIGGSDWPQTTERERIIEEISSIAPGNPSVRLETVLDKVRKGRAR